ncbi:NERD domain-containing protein [Nonomuraea sp. NPDC049655]|uniref:nuclease-related domain-containing DEAD/DEAH box helicase n=1 Tax=Nonomuraea sp. NPDC049655 TaxID=3364355 RepID=UPI0037AD22B0
MRVIPGEISVSTVRSSAERRVHAALRALPDTDSVAFHSVNLPEHAYKRLGEIDFLLITPEVLLTIEVKGGPISRQDGRWVFGHGSHRTPRSESPFDQARSAMYAQEARLKSAIGSSQMHQVASGYLVITTDVDLPPSTEWAPEMYLGSTAFDEGRGLQRALERARRYWPPKNRGAGSVIPSRLRRELERAIRDDFELLPTLAARSRTLDESFRRLTADQYAFIDVFSANNRTFCEGGAGSGKTFLAAEAARRWAVSGRVLVTCASPCLAAFLGSLLGHENIIVKSFNELGTVASDSFDMLIVDEAQDLMTFDCLERFDQVLRGGLDEGHWVVMADPNNQVLDIAGFDADALAHLLSIHPARVPLNSNCRNTTQIVQQTQLYTRADLGVAKAGAGDPVTFCGVQGEADEGTALDKHLDKLFANDVRPGDITVVSIGSDWETTSARGSTRFRKMVRLPEQLSAPSPRDRITWATVDEIKGLENRFVCVLDLDEDALADRLDRLYVAMTRPRIHLWIACRRETSAALERLVRSTL